MKKEIVNFKGTRQGLAIMLDTSCDYQELKTTLTKKISSNKEFFKGAKFALQPGAVALDADQTKELEDICLQYGLIPSGEIKPIVHRDKVLTLNKDSGPLQFSPLPSRPVKKSDVLPSLGLTTDETGEQTMMVRHHLRSGQKVHYGGNVIVMGDVNPGAEIVATGSIVVMGTLRGIAHAGASGDHSAFILAYSLRPTQLRIANFIGRSPDNEPPEYFEFNPEIARIIDGAIIVENYGTIKPRGIARSL